MEKEKTFAYMLRHARSNRGVSLRTLADETGLTHGMIFQYEQGHSYPSAETLVKICKVLDMNFKDVAGAIKKEKDFIEKTKSFYSVPPRYPELRKALLFFYSEKSYDGTKYASELEVKAELEKSPTHPIEQKILEELDCRIKINRRFKNAVDYFGLLQKKDIRDNFKKAGFEWWVASADFNRILISFVTKKGESDIKRFVFDWLPEK